MRAAKVFISMPSVGHPPTLVCDGQGQLDDLIGVLVSRCYEDQRDLGKIREPGGRGYSFWTALNEGLSVLESIGWHQLTDAKREATMDRIREEGEARWPNK